MRILVCMTHLSPWAQATAAMLQSFEHQVHVFDFLNTPDLGHVSSKVPGIVSDFDTFTSMVAGVYLVPSVTMSALRYVLAAPRLRRVAKAIRAEVILTLYGGGFGLMAYLSGFRPYCVYVVGSDVLLANRVARTANRFVLSAASQVFANGAYLASKTQKQAPNARVLKLLIGVDIEGVRLANLAQRPVQMICTRGFHAVYNNGSIIRALAKLPPDAPDFRMVFASSGELLTDSIGLADNLLTPEQRGRVSFLGGVTHQALRDELQRSHIILSMSRSDGTPTSVLEGMARGLFPILSDIPQNREWVLPGATHGALVPLDDPDALASAILTAIKRVDLCAGHALKNRRLVQERADALRNRRVLAEKLEAVVKNHVRA